MCVLLGRHTAWGENQSETCALCKVLEVPEAEKEEESSLARLE